MGRGPYGVAPRFSRRFKSHRSNQYIIPQCSPFDSLRCHSISFPPFSVMLFYLSPLVSQAFRLIYIFCISYWINIRLSKFSPRRQLSSEVSCHCLSSWLSSGPFLVIPRCLSSPLALALCRSPLSSVPSCLHLSLAIPIHPSLLLSVLRCCYSRGIIYLGLGPTLLRPRAVAAL